jgi:glycerol-1-phosphate dehydrogenase [NAD(P)+]
MHAIDHLYPGTASHGELAGVGALFCAHLRGDAGQARLVSACLSRHGLPRTPGDLGMSCADFSKAVSHAPSTRPGRYTILECLSLPEAEIAQRVEEYVRSVTG